MKHMSRQFVKTTGIALAFLAAAFSVGACDYARAVVWPTTVVCGVQEATELFGQVRAIVERDGYSPEFSTSSERGIEDLALQHGTHLVSCILNALLDKMAPRGVA